MKIILVSVVAVGFIFMPASTAHAYIDPLTGGFLFQILSGIFVAIMSAIYFIGDKINRLFSRIRSLIIGKPAEPKK